MDRRIGGYVLSLEQVVALSLRDRAVMDQLGPALRNDLVLSNPYLRRLVEFADDFLLKYRELPGDGDWQVWLEGLPEGMIRDGTKEALGRLWVIDTSGFNASYFAGEVLEHLRRGAAQVARARLNEAGALEPEALLLMAKKLESVQAGALRGLARLADVDTWAQAVREDNLIPTGFPSLDRSIGGWGKELWLFFADSGVGKSMLLQNCLANAARVGKRTLHITLELGLRPQIHRYYRQLAQATKSEFTSDTKSVKDRLKHWFKFAHGEVILLEYPAYNMDPDQLKRILERLLRTVGDIDLIALDYLDLMVLPQKARTRTAYEDLGRITHELRAVCTAFDLGVLSATQAVRKPEKTGMLTMRDMGDSYKKVQAADGLISLIQTPEEEEVHQGRLGLLKVRDSGGRGNSITLYINREMSLIQELDHPNTHELMRSLGHLPGQK